MKNQENPNWSPLYCEINYFKINATFKKIFLLHFLDVHSPQCIKITQKLSFFKFEFSRLKSTISSILKSMTNRMKLNFGVKIHRRHFLVIFRHCKIFFGFSGFRDTKNECNVCAIYFDCIQYSVVHLLFILLVY